MASRLKNLRSIKIPKLGLIRTYQVQCSLILTVVPLICSLLLLALLYCFSQINLYFLENNGMIISSEIRQAYLDQVSLELYDVSYYLLFLFFVTFVVSYVSMMWAVSPFVNAEKSLRLALANNGKVKVEKGWMSECPELMHTVQKLIMRLRDPLMPFPKESDPSYSFNFRFFLKFMVVFLFVSVATGYIMGIALGTVYLKIVNLAITLVGMNRRGHYFIAQEELLLTGVKTMTVVSGLIFMLLGVMITRYLSNMSFVFVRAIRLHHFPLKLRHSDIYHGLADAISEVAVEAKLAQEKK